MTTTTVFDSPEHFLGIFGKKNKEKRQKLGKKLGKVFDKLKTVVKYATLGPMILPLMPFAVGMRMHLKKKGFKPEKDIFKMVAQFHKHIVKKQNFEGYEEFYDEIGDYEENYDSANVEHIAPLVAAIPSLIGAIIKFFKGLKKKKEDGTATPEEAGLVESAEKGAQAIEAMPEKDVDKLVAKEEAEVNKQMKIDTGGGGGIMGNKNMIFILLGIVALIFFLRK